MHTQNRRDEKKKEFSTHFLTTQSNLNDLISEKKNQQ